MSKALPESRFRDTEKILVTAGLAALTVALTIKMPDVGSGYLVPEEEDSSALSRNPSSGQDSQKGGENVREVTVSSDSIEGMFLDTLKNCLPQTPTLMPINQDAQPVLGFTPNFVAHFDLTGGDLYGWVQSEEPALANFVYCPSAQPCQHQLPSSPVDFTNLASMKTDARSNVDGWECIVDGDSDPQVTKHRLGEFCVRN